MLHIKASVFLLESVRFSILWDQCDLWSDIASSHVIKATDSSLQVYYEYYL